MAADNRLCRSTRTSRGSAAEMKKYFFHFCDFHFNFSTLLEKSNYCPKVQFLKNFTFEFLHKNLDFD